jgi:hypothetical protein
VSTRDRIRELRDFIHDPPAFTARIFILTYGRQDALYWAVCYRFHPEPTPADTRRSWAYWDRVIRLIQSAPADGLPGYF